ncbi:MAG: DNA mismatch repair endonuclease MutL [Bacteroidales bacterium]|jgi:DNA mismatch repair protein MutL|nr:DNA mismatch repair endonuclease MutL [Bacteroidales bacterium]
MTDIIRLLPDSVANQIAAGEVIQRPASVLKELVENAIDAGATAIDIYLKDAGKTQVQVIDNGCGMSETDARMAFERHATSKIRKSEDIFSIHTLGFRGEALASIAAVAEVQVRSKRVGDELGTQVDIAATKVTGQALVQCPDGTTFTVKNLFYNVPVRRKFLKSDSTELNHILNEFKRIALAYEQVSLSISNNRTEIYRLPGTSLRQRIIHLFGNPIKQHLLNIETETTLVKVSGFITKPDYAKKSFGEQFFFANGRFIRHPYLHKAIVQAYAGILPPEYIPGYFIYLEVPPDSIDINIHPTKTEVKFEDEHSIYQILLSSVKQVLGKFNVVPSLDFETDNSIQIPVLHPDTKISTPQIAVDNGYNPFDTSESYRRQRERNNLQNWESLYTGFENENRQPDIFTNTPAAENEPAPAAANIHFQLKGKYILTPVKSGLMLIDQKRAHERILFEQYLTQMVNHSSASQQSLFPEAVELSPDELALWLELRDDFAVLGFDIRPGDGQKVNIHGNPGEMGSKNPGMVFRKLLDDFRHTETDLFESRRERLAALLAQESAIHYNQPLTVEEIGHLVEMLFTCATPNYSPAGKPVMHILKMEEIEGYF